MTKKQLAVFFGWLSLTTVADLITKAVVLYEVSYLDRIPVLPGFFDLTLTFNKGAAFGMFASIEEPMIRFGVLGIATLFALGVCVVLLRGDVGKSRLGRVAVALIVGGAIGNIVDRVRYGMVVDFLLVYVKDYYWPAFNIADSAICIGVGLLIFCTPSKEVAVQR